jgi:hypothetical protein
MTSGFNQQSSAAATVLGRVRSESGAGKRAWATRGKFKLCKLLGADKIAARMLDLKPWPL